jgi:hypothetical protein
MTTQEASKIINWVNIPETANSAGLFTEIADLGYNCLMRTYGWDNERDCMTSMSLIQIEGNQGRDLIKKAIEALSE